MGGAGGWGALCPLIQYIPFKNVIIQEYNNKLHTNIGGGGLFVVQEHNSIVIGRGFTWDVT